MHFVNAVLVIDPKQHIDYLNACRDSALPIAQAMAQLGQTDGRMPASRTAGA